jgi:transcriptional regulator with XRE-family HTH domain
MVGMEQAEFAEHVGYSRNYISALENGLRSPSLSVLARFRQLYGLSVDALIDSWESTPTFEKSNEKD